MRPGPRWSARRGRSIALFKIARKVLRCFPPATSTRPLLPTSTRTPIAPNTDVPTATPELYTLALNPRGCEQWGRPNPDCSDFNNKSPVRKLNIKVTLTNASTKTVVDWYPTFLNNAATSVFKTRYYFYSGSRSFPSAPAGQSRNVTFTAYVEANQYVSEMRMSVAGVLLRRCFAQNAQEIECP